MQSTAGSNAQTTFALSATETTLSWKRKSMAESDYQSYLSCHDCGRHWIALCRAEGGGIHR